MMRTFVCILVALCIWISAAHAQTFEASPNTIAVPEGPGSIGGMGEAFDVAANTGLASYGLSVPMPPGPGGYVPTVSLSYSSGAPNSALGVGWSLSGARICRKTDAGVPRYGDAEASGRARDADAFMLQAAVGAGDLVPVRVWPDGSDAAGWFALREVSTHLRARIEGDRWVVQTPSGEVLVFGGDEGAREGPAPAGFDGTYCWALSARRNVLGHTITYGYQRSGGRVLLDEIRYADDSAAPRSIRFAYEQRRDTLADWRAGFERRWELRLASIAVMVEGSQVTGGDRPLWQLDLQYEEDWNSSRLASARLTGENDEALPAQHFTYTAFNPEQPQEFSIGAPVIDPTLPGYRLVDLNGDALPDLLSSRAAGWEVYLNRGVFFDEAVAIAEAPSFDGRDADWTVADFDGDGLRDVVLRTESSGGLRVWLNRSTADDLRFGDGEAIDLPIAGGLNSPSTHLVDLNLDRRMDALVEAGGELLSGLSSIERESDLSVVSDSTVTWDGLVGVGERYPGFSVSGVDGLDEIDLATVHVSDMNGDGLVDLVRVFQSADETFDAVVHAGMGDGRFADSRSLSGLAGAGGRSADLSIIDLDQDGLGDWLEVHFSEIRYRLNRGGVGFGPEYAMPLPERGANSTVVLADVNGNGSTDVVLIDPEVDGWRVVDPIGEQRPGLLARAENGMGGAYELEWASTTEAARRSAAAGLPWRTHAPVPAHVVVGSTVSDGRGWSGTTGRAYRDAAWSWDDGAFRGFAAASVSTEGDTHADARVVDTLYYTGVGIERGGLRGFGGGFETAEEFTHPANSRVLAGAMRSQLLRGADGLLIKQTVTDYRVRDLGDGRAQLLATQQATRQPESSSFSPELGDWKGEDPNFVRGGATPRMPEPGEAQRQFTRGETEYDAWGFATRVRAFGYVDSAGSDIPGDEALSETDYAHNTAAWLLGVPIASRTLDPATGAILSRSRNFYDGEDFVGLPAGQVARGLLTRSEVELAEESRWVPTTRLALDNNGNVIASLDALGHRVELAYDEVLGVLPVRERLRLDAGAYADRVAGSAPDFLETTADYDTDRGLALSVTDFNGQSTAMRYDGLGRITALIAPGDSAEFPTTRWSYSFGNPVSSLDVEVRENAGEGGVIESRAYVDGLGRAIATLNEAPDGRYTVQGWTEYTEAGDPRRTFHPWEQDGADLPTGPPAVPSREFFYDAAGRELRSLLEDGALARTVFGAGLMTSYDPNDSDEAGPHFNTPTQVIADGLGRTVQTRLSLIEDGVLVWRDYGTTWDARGLPLSFSLPDAMTRRWEFDSLGRRTAAVDPDAGRHERRYDDLGHVIEQRDSLGAVRASHDPAGRLVEVQLVDGSGQTHTTAHYAYDVAAEFPANHTLGRLVARYEEGFDTFLDYTARGELSRAIRRLDGRIYEGGFRYDSAGRIRARVFADGSMLAADYDAQGRIDELPGIVDAVHYNDNGTVAQVDYDNGLSLNRGYDERLRVRSYSVGGTGAAPLLELALDYDAAGVPTQITDSSVATGADSLTRSWDYDALYRPLQMRAEAAGVVDYGYDVAYSLVSRRLSGGAWLSDFTRRQLDAGELGMTGDAANGLFAGPHHVTTVGTRSLGYDRAGRLVLDRDGADERSLEWDGAGRLRAVVLPDGRRVEHSYDGGYDRMTRVLRGSDGAAEQRTVYLSPEEELRFDGDRVEYRKTVFLGAERVAEVRIDGDPGVAESVFEAPARVPRALPQLSPQIEPAPNRGGGLGVATVLFLLSLCLAAVAARRRLALDRMIGGVIRGVSVAAALALLLSCGGSSTVVGPDDDVLSGDFVPEDAELVFLHAPRLGTPVLRTDADGDVLARMVSTPFGVQVRAAEDAAGADAGSGADGESDDFRFTDKEYDADTGYAYFGARYYDPSIGRWISPDPLVVWGGGGIGDANALAYVGNAATIQADPEGFNPPAIITYEVAETAATFVSIGMGANSAIKNFRDGRIGAGIVDTLGVAVDVATLPNPAPGGAGIAIQAGRGGAGAIDEVLEAGNRAMSAIFEHGDDVADAADTARAISRAAGEATAPGSAGRAADGAGDALLGQADRALPTPTAGEQIYRVYGEDSTAAGASWSPVNPASVPDYRDAAGLPSGGASGANNSGQFVIEGTLERPEAVVIVRPAESLDGNLGGLPEYIIPNPIESGAVSVNRASGANPEF